ncbi:hypothetical protein CPB84DRAFT_1732422 [Gymnopilus junonius]|uniref:Uncharacterized protein n=1 Tax=Gymnopilus junonius TaxID=109634 RepID=A0A9P5TLC7_GYMJU|nr:hypothetical protein CPB84DRAFT_1732422 [Gymnopilus junonius]
MLPSLPSHNIGLKAIATNAQFHGYISIPTLAETCPTERDGRDHLHRLFTENPKMNWCRPLDQVNVIRVVSRTYGDNGGIHGSDTIAAAAEKDGPVVLIGLPTPDVLFNIVWKLVPDFVKSKVTQWAKGKMDGPIANEITSYVKQALGLLPLPIPAFFVNAVTNLVIPPLVSLIISKLAGTQNVLATADASFTFPHHTAKSLKLMQHFDRKILLAAGLKPHHLPAHLKPTASPVGDDDDIVTVGQPDDRDSRTDMQQFYQADVPNGCKSLQLTQVIAAQLRTNPQSDPDPDTFGAAVWKTLDTDTKTNIRQNVSADPPNRAAIADLLYTPIRNILQLSPYSVPSPILDSFTSMKAPEVTEYVVVTQG